MTHIDANPTDAPALELPGEICSDGPEVSDRDA